MGVLFTVRPDITGVERRQKFAKVYGHPGSWSSNQTFNLNLTVRELWIHIRSILRRHSANFLVVPPHENARVDTPSCVGFGAIVKAHTDFKVVVTNPVVSLLVGRHVGNVGGRRDAGPVISNRRPP